MRISRCLRLVAIGRLLELRLSRRNQRQLSKQGVGKIHEPHFRWMVLLHAGILAARRSKYCCFTGR